MTKLAFAYAVAQPGFSDKTKEDILVILSETALSDAAVMDPGERMSAIMGGKLRVVRVVLSADRQAISTVIDSPDLSFPVSFAGTPQKVELKTFDGQLVEGRAFMDKPDSFMKATYQFSATFKAPIKRKAIPTAAEQKALADNPAAKAAIAYWATVRTGNVAAIKAAIVPEMRSLLDGPDGKQMLGLLKTMAPANPTVVAVETSGSTTVVTLEEKADGSTATTKVSMTLTGGQWLVTKKEK